MSITDAQAILHKWQILQADPKELFRLPGLRIPWSAMPRPPANFSDPVSY